MPNAPVSLAILAVLAVLALLGLRPVPGLAQKLLFRPYEVARGRRRWSVATSVFVHADLGHLISNALTLWFFGPELEAVLGSLRFSLLYAVGAGFSQLWSYLKHRDDPAYATLGASGAIAAVLFAYIVYKPTDGMLMLPLPVSIPAPLFGLLYLAMEWWSARQARGRINHEAHFGGALTGLAFVLFTDPRAYLRAAALLGL